MQPYLFYFGVLPHSKREMGKVSQHHYLLSSPTVNRTSSSVIDPTPTTPTGLGNPTQEQPCCQSCFKDRMDKLLQDRDCCSSTRQKEIYSCKSLSPLEAIKGEPGLTTKFRFTRFTHHHHTHSLSSNQHSVHEKVETWDLALSRHLLVLPLLQAPLGARLYRFPISLDVGHFRPEPV